MSKFIVACLALGLFSFTIGCSNKEEKSGASSSSQSMKGMDECSMCAGHQTAKADGTCPTCGMKLTKSNAK